MSRPPKGKPQPPSTLAREALRAKFAADLKKALRDLGMEGFDQSGFCTTWIRNGLTRSTAYRWLKEELDSGIPGQALAHAVNGPPPPDAPPLPAVAKPVEAMAKAVPVMDVLRECLQDVHKLREHALLPDGAIRLSKTLQATIELRRRLVDSLVNLQTAMQETQRIEAMHAIIMEEIAKESPAVAQRIMVRLQRQAAEWGVA